MIDLHCHVLPGLDDGARDVEDSVAMALQAAEDGISTICATPHVRHDHAVEIEQIPGRVAALNDELRSRGIAVEIVPGGELAATRLEALGPDELRAVTLGGAGGWVLLEPAPGPIDDALGAAVGRLAEHGLRAVIAHPERHAGADFRERLEALVAQGCLIQWTAEFVAGAQPGDLVLDYAQRGLVHLLGSDAHTSHFGRPVRLSPGFARLRAVLPAATVAWMERAAPAAILRGEPVAPPTGRAARPAPAARAPRRPRA